MSDAWEDLENVAKIAKKEADNYRIATNTAKWLLKDDEKALDAEKARQAVAAKSWEKACKHQNAILEASREHTRAKEYELSQAEEANMALEKQVNTQSELLSSYEEEIKLLKAEVVKKDQRIAELAEENKRQAEANVEQRLSANRALVDKKG